MTELANEDQIHTYLDDIKYQSVKDSRRSSFVSTDYKIVAQNTQAIRDIEKLQRIKTADFKRQEKAYIKRLEKLNCLKSKDTFNSSSSTVSSSLSSSLSPQLKSAALRDRRHSAPLVFWAPMSSTHGQSQSNVTVPSKTPIITRAYTTLQKPNDRLQNAPKTNGVCSVNKTCNSSHSEQCQQSEDDPFEKAETEKHLTTPTRLSFRSTPEVRRMSYDLQMETTKAALEKIDLIVKNQKRRATVSEGLQSDFVDFITHKNESSLIDRSQSIEEENASG